LIKYINFLGLSSLDFFGNKAIKKNSYTFLEVDVLFGVLKAGKNIKNGQLSVLNAKTTVLNEKNTVTL